MTINLVDLIRERAVAETCLQLERSGTSISAYIIGPIIAFVNVGSKGGISPYIGEEVIKLALCA